MSALQTSPVSIGGQELQVYPNPANGSFSLKITAAASEEVPVMVTDVVGKAVMQFTIATNSSKEISLDAPAGIYFMRSGENVIKLIRN
jgi:hypothetical protein